MKKSKRVERRRETLIVAVAVGCAVIIALLLFLLIRDTRIVLAVPEADATAFRTVLAGLAAREKPPGVRLRAFDGEGPALLERPRPGLAVVSLAPWVTAAMADGSLQALPAAAFRSGPPPVGQALLAAAGGARTGRIMALPIVFDPWVAAWHRDFIGGAKAAPPRDWTTLIALALDWRKKGASALALPGREPDAALAMLAILGTARGPAASAEAFAVFPEGGRETVADAFRRLAALQNAGLLQKGSFSYPWTDAVGLVLARQAAGVLLPISRFRALNPAASAPLIVARVPDFPGTKGYGLVADVRVLVMPARGARGRGAEKLVAYLAEPETQRALADALGIVPARLDAPPRDGASFEAMEAGRNASAVMPPPALLLGPRRAGELASTAGIVLRNPAAVTETIFSLFGEKP